MVNIKDVVDYPHPYFLRMEVFGGYPELEISKEEYERIRFSKSALSSALDIEKKYDIFLSNYAEMEHEFAQLTLNSLLDRNREYDDFFEMIRKISLRIANLLSSGRMYVDHVKHDIKSCVNDSTEAQGKVNELLSAQYDADSYYRFIEAIRNYSQHRSLPVHSVVDNSSADMDGDKKKLFKHTLDVYADKNILATDKKFKTKALNGLNEKIDLKKALRKYVCALSEVHIGKRDYIDTDLNESRKCLKEWMEKYSELAGECSKVSLYAIYSENGRLSNELPVSLEWDKSRLRLVKENKKLSYLSMHYASTISSDACSDD